MTAASGRSGTQPIVSARDWWAGGRIEHAQVGGSTREVFVRDAGRGPVVTLLHGFPASSLEWAGIWPALTARHRVLAIDFLGYGRSAKPAGHRYTVDEQVELLSVVWQRLGITRTSIVSYDFGAIITQLLLLRPNRPELAGLVFLNASLFAELYRPRPVQRVALVPMVGPLLWRTINEATFHRSWATVFGPDHPLDPALSHQHWLAQREGDPTGDAQRRLLRYIPERAARAAELAGTLDGRIPTSFLWGMADPVSGAQVATALRHRLRDPDLVEYSGVGHCPHLEIPDQVSTDLLTRLPAD